MKNGIWNLNMPQQAAFNSTSGPGFSVSLQGLVDTTFHSGVAEAGRVITANVTLDPEAGTPTLSYQWATAEGGDLAGETAATLTVDATSYETESVFCRVTADGIGMRLSGSAVVRQVPPALTGSLVDEIFDQGSGVQQVPLAGVFGGQALTISLPVDGGIASYDSPGNALLITTDALSSGVAVTVRAENSGGFVEDGLTVTIEAPPNGIMAEIDPLTAAGEGGIPVSGTTISTGDPLGHWEVADGLLVPSPAGDAADLGGGPYVLTLDDGQVIEVQVAPHPFDDTHWALSGPRADGVDIVIFDLPSDSGTPLTGIEMRFNGGPWQPLGGTAPGVYSITGLTAEAAYRVELRASNGAIGTPHAHGVMTVPDDPRGFRGWDPQIDLGTAGDWFVAPYGDDGNAGTETAPFRSVSAAAAAAKSAGGTQTIKVRAGIYRERVNHPANVIIEGYGTEKPRITSGDLLTGWTRCSDADAAVLRAEHAIPDNGPGDRSPIFKTSFPYEDLNYIFYNGSAHRPDNSQLAINLHEAGAPLDISKDQADMSSLFGHRNYNRYHVADNMTENGAGRIEVITDADVITSSKYTDTQLLAAGCFVYGSPNVAEYAEITAADVANNQITVDSAIARQSDTTPSSWRYALFNIPAGLNPGSFAALSDGTTVTVYLYPRDEGNLGLIEYSPRDVIVKTEFDADGCEMRGVHLSQFTNTGIGYEGAFQSVNNSGTSAGENHVLEHALVTGGESSIKHSNAITILRPRDCRIAQNTVYLCEGGGIFIAASGQPNHGQRNVIARNHIHTVGKNPLGWYDQWYSVIAHNRVEKSGLDAHASKAIMYGPTGRTHDFVFWGNEFIDATGYIVWQNASSPMVAFNHMQIKSTGAPWFRTITDDNQSFDSIAVNDTEGFVFNNTILPNPAFPSGGHAINVARAQSDIIYTLNNNVTHGMHSAVSISATGGYQPPAASVRGNVLTDIAGETVGNFDATNAIQTDLALVYADPLNQDYTPITGSPILGTAGIDMSAEIAAKAANFPHFTGFDRDYKNQIIDWSDLPVGADTGLPFDRTPVTGGLSLVAHGLTGSSAYRNSSAYPAVSYTPQNAGNELLIAVALHNGASNASVTWRGQTLPALFVNTAAASTTRTDVIALYRAPAGAGLGDLVVTPTGEANAATMAFLEVSGLAATAIPSGQLATGVQVSTSETTVGATLTNVIPGNAVLALTSISGDAGAVSDSGSDLVSLTGGGQIATTPGGGLSDMTLHVQILETHPGGAVTANASYQNAAQSGIVLVELASG